MRRVVRLETVTDFAADGRELARLPHDLVLSDRLRERLAGPPNGAA